MSWFRAYQYPTMTAALTGYSKVRELLTRGTITASVRRILFEGIPLVIVGGEADLEPEMVGKIEDALSFGELFDAPPEIERWHLDRIKTRVSKPGDLHEHRYL